MMEPSFDGPAARISYSLCTIAVLLLASTAHWYLTWRVNLPFPVAGAGTKANKVQALEEAKLKVSRPMLGFGCGTGKDLALLNAI